MKYIRIKNNGIIEPAALFLLGASTKRNDHSKIGMFGSGNKYAIAYLIRNGYEVKIFAGKENIDITTETESFRSQSFDVICINGQKSGITTEFGKDWEFWQAMRELYCNAMDEGGASLDFVQHIEPSENETHFYIDTKKDVTQFVSNFDNYFSTSKKVIFNCPTGSIVEKSGNDANIYRKGVRCFNANKKSVFDYDFNNIEIDENRLVKHFWDVDTKIWSLIYQCDNKEVIKTILLHSGDRNYIEGAISDYSALNVDKVSDAFRECLKEMKLAPESYSGLLKQDETHNHVIIPTTIFKNVRGIIPENNVGDKFKISPKGAMYREIEMSEMYKAIIKSAFDFLHECDMEIPFQIKCCIFDDKDVLGSVDENAILIADICLEKGINEVVNTIIEEYIHLKYNVHDETRGFQTAMITEFISYMKRKNAYVI